MPEMTSAGRKLYKEGNDYYSEKTVTVETDYGWVNVPSVDAKGNIIPEDKLVDIVNALGPIDPLTGKELEVFEDSTSAVKAAEARTKELSKEIQEYAEGGDVERDPISGNEVPKGALPEEVRDDVPAMLSEGEFVLPADVVRYIGLNNLMKLRDEAKEGLAKMDAQGQMGNAEEATEEEDGPEVDMSERMYTMLEEAEGKKEPAKMAAGGSVVNPLTAASSSIKPPQKMPALTVGAYTPPNISTYLPATAPQAAENIAYIGPNGEEVTIRFIGGNPTQPIPAGFTKKSEVEAAKKEEETVDTTDNLEDTTITTTPTCPPGQQWNGLACVPTGGEYEEQKAEEQTLNSTEMALAQLLAQENPDIAKALKTYDESKLTGKDIFSTVLGGPLGFIKALIGIGQNVQDKGKVLDLVEKAKTDVTKSLLRDWNETTRSEKEIREAAQDAMDKGASLNLALSIAIDDKFDTSVLDNVSDLGAFEQSISDRLGVNTGSDQASRLAKEEIDLWDGDLAARDAFLNDTGSSDSTSSGDSYGTTGNGSDPGDGGGAIGKDDDGNDFDSFAKGGFVKKRKGKARRTK